MSTDGLDPAACQRLVYELVSLEGKVVFTHSTECHTPGGGGSTQIVRWQDHYFRRFDDHPLTGPFETLDDALDENCRYVSYLTERIECSELSTHELLQRLWVWPEGDPNDLELTTRDFRVNSDWFTLKVGEAIVPRLRAVGPCSDTEGTG